VKFLVFNKKNTTLCLLILLLSTNLFSKELLTNIAITDGDSLKGVYKNELIKIRLAEIDAPELRQAFGLDSKNCLISLIQESNNEVFFKFKEKDRYDRHVGWIYSKNLDINLEMVKKGCAWVYDRYVKRKVLFKHQDNARENNIGLWKNSEAIAPWKWRRAN
jgi:micrococcal nuclease